MNRARLIKVRNHIALNPDRYVQPDWDKCIAGIGVKVAGIQGTPLTGRDVFEKACQYFNISPQVGQKLFGGWPSDINSKWMAGHRSGDRKQQAEAALDAIKWVLRGCKR